MWVIKVASISACLRYTLIYNVGIESLFKSLSLSILIVKRIVNIIMSLRKQTKQRLKLLTLKQNSCGKYIDPSIN